MRYISVFVSFTFVILLELAAFQSSSIQACQVIEERSKEVKPCKFPFILNGKYSEC